MTEIEAYRWLGSHPCESCDNCQVDENLNYIGDEDEEYGIKPRHYKNGLEMMEECHENHPCYEAVEYDKRYKELVNET